MILLNSDATFAFAANCQKPVYPSTKLRANGRQLNRSVLFPFMLSLSKHSYAAFGTDAGAFSL
jgi:hypothetical protein